VHLYDPRTPDPDDAADIHRRYNTTDNIELILIEKFGRITPTVLNSVEQFDRQCAGATELRSDAYRRANHTCDMKRLLPQLHKRLTGSAPMVSDDAA